MKFDRPTGPNPIDRTRVVGKPFDRIDGRHKVAGVARYAYEQHDVVANQAYGYILGASIPKGRIRSLDDSEARRAPGVVTVVSAANAGTLDVGEFYAAPALAGPAVRHYHQAVAIVVAETFEHGGARRRQAPWLLREP